MSYGILKAADVSDNDLGDAGATALCPLLEHQPNLQNLNLYGKCTVQLRFVSVVSVIFLFVCKRMYVCTACVFLYHFCNRVVHLVQLGVFCHGFIKFEFFFVILNFF